LFGHLWQVELTYRYIADFKFTLRSQQPDIVPIICHPVSLTTGGKPVANLPTGINNTGETNGKFATGVVDTGGAP
jgi:hypothetical protein